MHDAGDEHDGRAEWLVRAAGDVPVSEHVRVLRADRCPIFGVPAGEVVVDEICGEQSVTIGSRRFRVVGVDEVTGTVSLAAEDAD